MPTSEQDPQPDEIAELRRQIIGAAEPPAEDVADFDRLANRALVTMTTGAAPAAATEIRVRLAGKGVPEHSVPVHVASQLLDGLQSTVTAVGSALRKRSDTPKHHRKIGIKQATELTISPQIQSGSVVFFLEHVPAQSDEGTFSDIAVETVVDQATEKLFKVMESAERDDPDELGGLEVELQRLGAMVASKLDTLASNALAAEIDLDLGLRTPAGRRKSVVLRSRGAHAIRDAVDRSRERETFETVSGKLRTVSDGADKVRIELPDKTIIRAAVGNELGLNLGPWLGKIIDAEIESTVRWNLTTGKERKTHKLVGAVLASDPSTLQIGDE